MVENWRCDALFVTAELVTLSWDVGLIRYLL